MISILVVQQDAFEYHVLISLRVAKFDSIKTNQKLLIGKPSIQLEKFVSYAARAIETLLLSCSDYLYIKTRATSFAILGNTPKANRYYSLAND